MNSAVGTFARKVYKKRPTKRRVTNQTLHARIADDVLRQDQLVNVLEIAAVEAIEQGLSAGDLYRLVDQALINTAVGSLSSLRRKPNQSQVAAQTGLTRPEVRSLVTQLGSDRKEYKAVRRNKVAQTFEYLATKSSAARSRTQPFTVRFEGKGHSFSNAVRIVGGDIPPAAMLKEFSRRGLATIVRKNSKARRLVISPNFNLNKRSLGFSLAIGVSKAAHSTADSQDTGKYLFETVCYSELAVRQFTRLLAQKAPAFFESLGAVRIDTENNTNKPSRKNVRNLRVALIYWNESTGKVNLK